MNSMIRTVENVIWYVLLTFGIPGNILSAIVWLRRHVTGKNSSAIYLAALAINDLVFLLFNLVIHIMHVCGFHGGWSYVYLFACYLVDSAAVFEPLLVLGFSVERLIAIVRPLQVCCISLFAMSSWVRAVSKHAYL